jgi:uncharacterized membrane protein (UPF0127 family)
MLPRRLERLPSFSVANDAVICQATTLASRLLGLAWLREPPSGYALLIADCRSVHTFGMRFAIDVAFLDARGRALRIERSVPRRRMLTCRGAFAVLEAPAGAIELYVSKEMQDPVRRRSRDR